ncbi:MAG: hypothetical protein ACOX75_07990 [Lachnospiraceae bacterium]
MWFMKLFMAEPHFEFRGNNPTEPSIILSNHVGMKGPVKWYLYFKLKHKLWGTHEMTEGFLAVHKYLTATYFHRKKHFSPFMAMFIGTIASPFVNMFYKALDLIPTYRDHRFRKTVRSSFAAIRDGYNIVIFPEDSSDGYHDHLTKFFAGFAVFADNCLKKGVDLPVFTSYFKKEENRFIIDAPILFSQLKKNHGSFYNIAAALCNRTNALGHALA